MAVRNFIAEFLILLGTFTTNAVLAVIASLGLVLSALYSLRMVRKVFLGPKNTDIPVKDLNGRELFIMVAMSISILALGLYPQPILDMVKTTLRELVMK
ncbi:MAG: hypothetical protein EOO04_22430 [Chitinophagaceae bacterium]|nr:MAG: hypothetical protein EOO04_22430 [Chitinophagaceae bacterium]